MHLVDAVDSQQPKMHPIAPIMLANDPSSSGLKMLDLVYFGKVLPRRGPDLGLSASHRARPLA